MRRNTLYALTEACVCFNLKCNHVNYESPYFLMEMLTYDFVIEKFNTLFLCVLDLVLRVYIPYFGRLQKEEALKVRVTKASEASEKEKVFCPPIHALCYHSVFRTAKMRKLRRVY